MKKGFLIKLLGVCAALVLVLGLSGSVLAQGKGKGNGRGNGNGKGNSSSRGNSDKSKKSDDSLWNGFPDNKSKSNRNNPSLNNSQRFKGLSKKTGLSQDTLRDRFEYERQLNPRLTYGQFVAAHMISRNHRNVSTDDILGGLRGGRSIGQVLNNKGWDKNKVNKERQRIKDFNKDDKDYDDRDDWWGF